MESRLATFIKCDMLIKHIVLLSKLLAGVREHVGGFMKEQKHMQACCTAYKINM